MPLWAAPRNLGTRLILPLLLGGGKTEGSEDVIRVCQSACRPRNSLAIAYRNRRDGLPWRSSKKSGFISCCTPIGGEGYLRGEPVLACVGATPTHAGKPEALEQRLTVPRVREIFDTGDPDLPGLGRSLIVNW